MSTVNLQDLDVTGNTDLEIYVFENVVRYIETGRLDIT